MVIIPKIDIGAIKARNFLSFLFTLTIFFPFIPAFITTSDTQPTLTMLALTTILIFFQAPSFYKEYQNQNYSIIVYFFCLILFSIFSIIFNATFSNNYLIITRYISFLQFLAAIVIGYTNSFNYFKKYIENVFVIYFIFTIIYFLTNGAVENILIRSREFGVGLDLASTGRGSRTLSPEPSFFATQMFNLYIIYTLLLLRENKDKLFSNKKMMAILCFSLIASLSGYGFVLLFILIYVFFKRYIFIALGLAVVFNSFIIEILSSYSRLRAIGLIVKILKNNPLIFIKSDKSVLFRFASFYSYIERFFYFPLFGDGFSLNEGGGFISLAASLGIVGLLFISYFFYKILRNVKNANLKALLIFWFFLNFFSGPIGIPALGIILGLIARPNDNVEMNTL